MRTLHGGTEAHHLAYEVAHPVPDPAGNRVRGDDRARLTRVPETDDAHLHRTRNNVAEEVQIIGIYRQG